MKEDEEDEQNLINEEDRRDHSGPSQQEQYFQDQQRRTFMQQGYGQRLSTIEEHHIEDEQYDVERIKRITRIYAYVLAFYLVIIIAIALLFFLSQGFREGLLDFFQQFAKPTARNLLILFIIGMVIKVTGFPISIYELAVAYIQQNYFLSLGLLVLAKTSGCYFSFLFSQHHFAQNAQFWIQTIKQLKVIGISIEKYPYKVSFLVRFMWLPIIAKNYGLGLFRITSLQFLIPTVLQVTVKSAFLCFVGINLKNFYDVVSGDTLAESIYIRISIIIISLILFMCLFYICKREYDQLEQEYNEIEQERKRVSITSASIASVLNRYSTTSEH